MSVSSKNLTQPSLAGKKNRKISAAARVALPGKEVGSRVAQKGLAIRPTAALYIVGLRSVLFRFREL